MGEVIRDRLPGAITYFELEGVPLKGHGRWKTGPCHFHGSSDSLRVNVQSGGWCCMNCGAKGGDVLAYAMQRHGLGFVDAARALGAYIDDNKPHRGPAKAATLSARDAMQLVAFELNVAVIVNSDIRAGVIPSDTDWQRFIAAAGRIDAIAQEYRA
jgi:hypothetical protein